MGEMEEALMGRPIEDPLVFTAEPLLPVLLRPGDSIGCLMCGDLSFKVEGDAGGGSLGTLRLSLRLLVACQELTVVVLGDEKSELEGVPGKPTVGLGSPAKSSLGEALDTNPG